MGFQITGDPASDAVLDEDPFALLLGMLLDQQYPMEHAFRGPSKILERFGTLDPAKIADAEPEAFAALCATPPAVHRFPGSMATRIQAVAREVVDRYDGDTSRIWNEAATGPDLVKRIMALPGFGKQKAKIFLALLGKQLGVRPKGWREAAGEFGVDGSRKSVADITNAKSLGQVREYKKTMKAAKKAAAAK
jgi:uncharacterized HhH-GPD family protein